MTKELTAKRSRTPLEDYFRAIFFATFENRCVYCGEVKPLQLGHIQRHEDDGPATLDDLQPLCAECNGRHNKSFSMEDWRPDEWRSKFLKLLAQSLRTELAVERVTHPAPKSEVGSNTLNAVKPLENTELIPWTNANFRFNSVLSVPFPDQTHPYPLEEYRAVVEVFVRRGAEHKVAPIPHPDEKCWSKLCSLVKKLGRTEYEIAAEEFLRQQKWFDQDDRGNVRGRPMKEPWEKFADNPKLYLADAEKRKALEIQGKEVNKLSEQKFREQHAAIWMQPKDEVFEAYRKSKKFELLALISRTTQLWLDRKLPLTLEQSNELGDIRKLVEAASNDGPELAEYKARAIACTKFRRGQVQESAEQEE